MKSIFIILWGISINSLFILFCVEFKKNNFRNVENGNAVIMMGQSNMVGYDDCSDIWEPIENGVHVYCSYYCYNRKSDSTWSEKLPLGLGFGAQKDTCGPELGLGEMMKDTTIIKITYPGLGIAHFLPGSQIYKTLLKFLEKKNLTVSTFFWLQGETDSVIEEESKFYLERFTYLVSSLKKDITNDIKIVSALIRSVYNHSATIRSALINISDSTVETDDLSVFDGIHYDSNSTFEIGRRFYLKYKDISQTFNIIKN